MTRPASTSAANRAGLASTSIATPAMTMMADRSNIAGYMAEQLGISVSTLYAYVDGEGRAKPRARKLLGR